MNDFLYKKIGIAVIVALITVVLFIPTNRIGRTLEMDLNIQLDHDDLVQVFFSETNIFSEDNSVFIEYKKQEHIKNVHIKLPKKVKFVRIDTGTDIGAVSLEGLRIKYFFKDIDISNDYVIANANHSGIEELWADEDGVHIVSNSIDPYFYVPLELSFINQVDLLINILFKTLSIIFLVALYYVVKKYYVNLFQLIKELFQNRHLIRNLAINDFKTKYAGSYLGIIWAFIQPSITVTIYWFVFQFGLRVPQVEDVPFALWLVCGMVPWFFFSDAIMNATNSLLEYSYLVKKVVFKISILPIVKILSSMGVHFFFVLIVGILATFYGYTPQLIMIQIIYYLICLFAFILGLSYISSAVIVFFKDLGQIITIILQIGMWMTPIMWNAEILPEQYQWILMLNPVYYVVSGYRNTFIYHRWFWQDPIQLVVFWVITLPILLISAIIFKRLKTHFADVL